MKAEEESRSWKKQEKAEEGGEGRRHQKIARQWKRTTTREDSRRT